MVNMLEYNIPPGGMVRRFIPRGKITDVYFEQVDPGSEGSAKSTLLCATLDKETWTDHKLVCELVEGTSEHKSIAYDLPERQLVEFKVMGSKALHFLGKIEPIETSISPPPEASRVIEKSLNSAAKEKSSAGTQSGTDLTSVSRKHHRSEEDEDCQDPADKTARSTASAPLRNIKRRKGPNGRVRETRESKKGKRAQVNVVNVPVQGLEPKQGLSALANASPEHQVVFVDIKTGNGAEVTSENTVTVEYTASLENGTLYGVCKQKPVKFSLGDPKFVRGWQSAMLGMHEGGRRIMVVPPEYGYGAREEENIPPNSTLVIDCTLCSVE